MGLRLPNLDYYTMLSGIGDSLANAYDKYQAPKLLAEAMASRGQDTPTSASAAILGGQPVPATSSSTPQPVTGGYSQPAVGNAPADQVQRARERMSYLVNEKGLSPTVAAGIVGNTWHESGGFFPKVVGDGGDSIGEPQFNKKGEQPAFLAFAAQNNRDPYDWKTQYDFVTSQLNGPYKGVLQKMTAAQSPADAALAFSTGYERPNPDAAYNDRRVKWANTALRLVGVEPSAAQASTVGSASGAVPPQNQVADASGVVVPTSVGASRGVNYSPEMIQRLMQNPYTKSIGAALMQAQIANMSGKPDFKQFGNTIYRQGPDGSLTPVGNIPKDPQLVDVPDGKGGTQKMWLRPGQSSGPTVGGVDTGKDIEAQRKFEFLQENAEKLGLPDPKSTDPVAQKYWRETAEKLVNPGGVTVNNIPAQAETKQAGEVGGAKGEVFSNYIKAYDGAHEKMNALNAMQNFINSNPNMYMGAGADSVLSAKKFAKGVGEALKIPGLDNIDVSSQEGVEKFGRQLAGAAAKTVGGARVTNFELEQFIKANPGLLTTREGNTRLINIMQQMAQREMALSNMAADFTDKNPGASLSGFRDQIKKYDEANPIKDVDGTILSGSAVKPTNGDTSQRAQLPQGYTAAKAVDEARKAMATPGLSQQQKDAIRTRLKSFGIDPARAGE